MVWHRYFRIDTWGFRSEKVLDALVTEDIEIVRFWKGKVEANTLTRRQFITQLYHKMELESLTELGLKHRHFAAVALIVEFRR
ncbi:hypothetical protein CAEBREN_15727 [Caenorhabditis brenneri]|uniref:Uncharacterized protein n=1 Tax=Caenorhabditis brenneri TaxID=135651 RepID=G0NKD0_CAEBE|nr:hypothetical protein CAEBREN_15727 [Caenorhabditis brenneri]